jgi:Protein of unknown function (DUF2752)
MTTTRRPAPDTGSGCHQHRNSIPTAPRHARATVTPVKATQWLAATAVASTALLTVVDPTKPGRYAYPLCPFRTITGLDCPVCGTTRASWALLHGHIARAVGYNALWCMAVPLLAWAWILAATGRWPTSRHPFRWRHAGTVTITVAIVFAIARNLPWQPLRALRS